MTHLTANCPVKYGWAVRVATWGRAVKLYNKDRVMHMETTEAFAVAQARAGIRQDGAQSPGDPAG
ncbi:hypothetical protein [Deinococcus sp. QL22]|uniref:hypothetical protein n=1 Tax=Deinococcus sp. QL22 TaxID=2939437 RepID=UPI0020172FAF|nr:hypothetical protein [Deinococcus sp. QL22]UQN09034.1 hypothetical protein M1R55_23540 [Deinococcus sp. QL22]